MLASSPIHEALWAITQQSKERKRQLQQTKHEIELSKCRLDLEYQKLSLQRRRLDIQEKEIAIKREELSLALIEKTAYMTMALDRDVQSRVMLAATNRLGKERSRLQQGNLDQEARETSTVVAYSDNSAIDTSLKQTTAAVHQVDSRADRRFNTATRKKTKTDIRASPSIKSSPISPGRNRCRDPFRRSMSVYRSISAVCRWKTSNFSRTTEKKGTKPFWKQYRSLLWKKLKCASDRSNATGGRCYRL
jgi:hypothetical protein